MAKKSAVLVRLEEAQARRSQMLEAAGANQPIAHYHAPANLDAFIEAVKAEGLEDMGCDETGSVPWTFKDNSFRATPEVRMVQVLIGAKHSAPVIKVYGSGFAFVEGLVSNPAADHAAEKALTGKRHLRNQSFKANMEALMAKAAAN